MTLKLTYAGFNYVADVDGSYSSADSISTMIAQTGSNSIALTIDYGINASNSTVYGDYNANGVTGNTETTTAEIATIKEAERDGLSVLVRPLIDFTANASQATLTSLSGNVYADGDWRAYYMPTDTTALFNSYDTVIVAQANAAKAGGAQIFDIGTEIDQLTGPAYLSQWTEIINDVKTALSGTGIKLTYSAISDDAPSPWQYGHRGELHYLHIELDSHDILVAERAPSETFLDSRLMFHNAPEFGCLYLHDATTMARDAPRFCAPHRESGYALEAKAIRLRLAQPVAA